MCSLPVCNSINRLLLFLINTRYRAEIASSSDDSGYSLWSSSPEDVITTKYTHHSRVDGDNTYGSSLKAFLRRNLIGGDYGDQSTYPGTRSIYSRATTAVVKSWCSNI